MSWADDYPLLHPRRRHVTSIEHLHWERNAHQWILENTPLMALSPGEQVTRLECIRLVNIELESRKWQ